jgi:anti-sigma regulatory factor (Ser/Thr protein kinase)
VTFLTQPDEPYFASLTVPSRIESIRPAAAFLVQVAKRLKVPVTANSLFEVAIVEVLTNALKHGNKGRRDASIVCEIEVAERRMTVRVFDAGTGFTLPAALRLPEPSLDDLDLLPKTGYGLPIIRSVFPAVKTVTRGGRFGVELPLTF